MDISFGKIQNFCNQNQHIPACKEIYDEMCKVPHSQRKLGEFEQLTNGINHNQDILLDNLDYIYQALVVMSNRRWAYPERYGLKIVRDTRINSYTHICHLTPNT